MLDGPRRPARSGRARALVALLHGYGADGNDLIGLADALGPHLPDVAFVSPNAPEPCRVNPMGRQWFSIPWLDGSSDAERDAGFARAVPALDAFLDAEMARVGVTEAETALVGFSQGTMMALHVGPRRPGRLAGIVGFSGRYLTQSPDEAIPHRPPVLLVHGDLDEMLPVAELEAARKALAAQGFEVTAHVSRGIGHGIAPDGLGLALGFLKERLPG